MNQLEIRGAQWAYLDLNQDQQEVILLVHGHPFDHSMWKYQYESLKGFRLILPDLKGYGKSAHDYSEIYIEEQAIDLALLLDELQIKSVHLIGLSMGGQIIVEFSRLFPDRVKSLLICASTPSGETSNSYRNRISLAETIAEIGMEKYTLKDIHKYINLEETPKDSTVYQHLFSMMSQTKTKGAIASHRGRAKRRDNFDYLSQVKVPTLVVAAEKDYFFPVDVVKKVAEKISTSQFVLIKKAGHLPNMENPEQFNRAMMEFYSRIKNTGE